MPNTAGIFAAGFLMHPIGGWLFGSIADRNSRKNSMVISVAMMYGGSLLIACNRCWAYFPDRIGRRSNMLLFGALGALVTVSIPTALQGVSSPVFAGLRIVLALAIVSFYTSISGIVKAEMFPPEVRALGVGLAYTVANSIFGGSA